ncbi:MAG TPA: glycosyl hydrolase family 18 protein [Gemmatimonadales bacterium]|jgi:spore germination protein YaaH|nr:glycosyl hydrolase family 18 protein [Gemmatimonadales bacterium]
MEARFLVLASLLAFGARDAPSPGLESLWYLRGEESIQAFLAHADQISIVSPQVFVLDSTGEIRGAVDPRVIATARAKGVKLIPLVMNPGFDQASIHRVLTEPAVRVVALHALAELCRVNRFDGIQFDFENFHVSDRDAFTAFTRAAVDSVHRAGCSLSAAVVPRLEDDPGQGSYDRWIHDNWRAGFDYKALADTLDFISFMTYAQHTGGSSPGPVAGYPWMAACLDFLLAQGVPPGKISLGLAGYSDWWFPTYDEKEGARLRGSDISYLRGREILADAKATAVWDSVQMAPRAMWESHGVFQHLWLEDARAFMVKRRLAVERGLRGYSVWLLGSEDPAVWAALREAAPNHR